MFGYEPDGVTFRVDEANAVRYAAKEIIAGRTLRSVTRDLRERGLTSTMGNELTASALRAILINPRITALSTWGPTDSHGYRLTRDRQVVGEGTWPALLEREAWERVHAILTNPARAVNRTGNTPRHLLSGLLVCACGEPMYRRTRRTQAGGAQRGYYSCKKTSEGPHTHIGDEVEGYVAEVIQFRLESDDMAIVLNRARASGDGRDSLASEANKLSDERRAVLDRRDALEGAMVSGELDPTTFIRVSGKLDEQIADFDNRLAVLYEREDQQLLDIPHGEYVRSWWEAADLESRRRLIDVLVELRIGPGVAGSKRFDPARVRIIWKV